MPKAPLSPAQAFDIRQAIQVSTLEALMRGRRWEPGDLVFQGGTSLNLAYGSPRFSEDLDFLVRSSLDMDSVLRAMRERLVTLPWLPKGWSVSLRTVAEESNPVRLMVVAQASGVLGAVRVQTEFWRTAPDAVARVGVVVRPVHLATGPAAGVQAMVPAADLEEITADKVFALAARPYLKARDVFDLYWLAQQHGLSGTTADQMRVRLAIYPTMAPDRWLTQARARRQELSQNDTQIALLADMGRWLPSFWPLRSDDVAAMAAHAGLVLENGARIMRTLMNNKPGPQGGSPS